MESEYKGNKFTFTLNKEQLEILIADRLLTHEEITGNIANLIRLYVRANQNNKRFKIEIKEEE